MTAAAEAAVGEFGDEDTALLCDADLGESAAELVALVEAVEAGECDLAIGALRRARGRRLRLHTRLRPTRCGEAAVARA